MSLDWMLLTPAAVELDQIADATSRVSPRLRVRPDTSRRFLLVVDDEETPLVWLSPARRVQDAAAAASRLLPPGASVHPWWTEVVVPVARGPWDPHQGTGVPALLRSLAEVTGGTCVRLSDEAGGVGSLRSTWEPQLGDDPCDLTTPETGVLLQSRSVLGLGPWLLACLLWARDHQRPLVVVSPPTTRLTPAVERLVRQGALGWVVDDRGRQWDARTGRVVRWDDHGYRTTAEPAGLRTAPPAPGWQLVVEADTVHASGADLVVGRFAERVAELVGAGRPTGQGLLEPVEAPWHPGRLTREARRTSPASSRVVLTLPAADGYLTVAPQPVGVLEKLELVVRAGEEPLDLVAMQRLGQGLLAAGAQLVTVSHRRQTLDRLAPPGVLGPLLPGLVVAAPARFPGLHTDRLRTVGPPGAQLGPAGWVLPFPVGPDLDAGARAGLLRDWVELLRLLQQHDRLATAMAAQRS